LSALHDVLVLAEQCFVALQDITSRGGTFRSPSPASKLDYAQVARRLLNCAVAAEGGLTEVVQNTGKARTFFKRLAALRYHCYVELNALMQQSQQISDDAGYQQLQPKLAAHLTLMQALAVIQRRGMTSPRDKRSSKRQSLRGLPADWREAMYQRGQKGKYVQALLVSALTGCRPSELVRGIKVWKEHDKQLGKDLICFRIEGSKVKSQQGQPTRCISYVADDAHPLVAAMRAQLDAHGPVMHVEIINAANFTVEVRRLAARLWPAHKHTITAYCFRHQWAADTKRLGDGDAVSRGLGHASAKTRRNYGTAGQANGPSQLQPIKIEADRVIRSVVTLVQNLGQRSQQDYEP
jgi:hypothetical protein